MTLIRERKLWTTTALAAALALGLAACDNKDASTPGEKLDTAIAKTEQAAENAAASTSQAASQAATATSEAATEAKAEASVAGAQAVEAVKEAGTEAKEAVAAAGTAVGNAVDDATITATISANLAKDAELSAIRIDVDTKGGAVTLTGPAPNAAAKERAETIAKGVSGVSSVTNKLEVKAM